MIELRKVIQSKLRSIHSRVYFHVAPDNAVFPYLVYDLPTSFANEDQDVFNLDVDVWDAPRDGDTTEIETIADAVWRGLHRYKHIDSDIQLSVYRENRLVLEDDDARIRRRKLIFQLRYYDRGLNE